MYVDVIERLLVTAVPFPYLDASGMPVDGMAIKLPEQCRLCRQRDCATIDEPQKGLAINECTRGFNFVHATFETRRLVLVGLCLVEQYSRLPRQRKKAIASQLVTPTAIHDWYATTVTAVRELDVRIAGTVASSLGMLHDVQSAVSAIIRNAESFVLEQPGDTFESKVDQLEPSLRAVVKAVQLLYARLSLIPLLTNPDAARYGKKHPTPIYKVVDRLVRTFRSVAEKRRVALRLAGQSFNQPMAYDSVETIVLVLVENAIKFTQPGQSVDVSVNDTPGGGAEVQVRSFSPEIPAAEKELIFQRGYRGEFATKTAAGSGLGLFLARTVARAHMTEIRVSSEPSMVTLDGIPYCNNTFAFTLR